MSIVHSPDQLRRIAAAEAVVKYGRVAYTDEDFIVTLDILTDDECKLIIERNTYSHNEPIIYSVLKLAGFDSDQISEAIEALREHEYKRSDRD